MYDTVQCKQDKTVNKAACIFSTAQYKQDSIVNKAACIFSTAQYKQDSIVNKAACMILCSINRTALSIKQHVYSILTKIKQCKKSALKGRKNTRRYLKTNEMCTLKRVLRIEHKYIKLMFENII